MWNDVNSLVHKNHHFIITTHQNPDGDGIGSATALIELLLQLGKQVRFICDSPIPEKYRFLDFHRLFEMYDPAVTDLSKTQLFFILDANRRERIGRLSSLIDKSDVTTICIDHHALETPFTPYAIVDPAACATGAMIYTLYKECGIQLNLAAATGIYASILYDTGRFSNSSTNRTAHRIADECIKIGVDPDAIYSHLFQHVPLAQVKMFAKALQRMETFLDNRIVVQEIRKEDYDPAACDIETIDFEYILESNKSIEEVECVVLLRELAHNQVRVSIRSKTALDVSPLMKELGGGGHSKAGGATIHGAIEDIKSLIIKKLSKLLQIKHQ